MTQRDSLGRQWLDLIATVLVAIAAIVVVARAGVPTPASPRDRDLLGATEPVTINISSSPLVGKSTAPVALVVFADFECEFCREVAVDVLPELKDDFLDAGKIQLVFKHFPLEQIHAEARRVSELAACAGSSEYFWRTHDWIFGLGGRLDGVSVKTLAANVPVNVAEVEECLGSKARELVDSDIALGRQLGVRATPEFFVGSTKAGVVTATRRLKGVQSPTEFRAVIGAVLAGK